MRFIVLIVIASLAAACGQMNEQPVRLLGQAQGTYYSIIYYDKGQRDFQYEIDSILKDFDLSVSLWVPQSVLSRVNGRDTSVLLDKYFMDNFRLSYEVAEKTGGSFDMTVGALVRAWGFGFDEEKKVSEEIVDSIMTFTGYKKVRLEGNRLKKEDPRTSLDFNAIAQGYSVDLLCDFLESKGIHRYLIDIGGEVRGKGRKTGGVKWKVGIERPAKSASDPRDIQSVVAIEDKALATSGNYRKFYEENGVRYSHTIDPKTGYPVQHSLLSVTVMADRAAVADAYATAFMVMGLEKSLKYLEKNDKLAAYFIYSQKDGSYTHYATENFKDYLNEDDNN
jgi:FAD:protein FMN transferase